MGTTKVANLKKITNLAKADRFDRGFKDSSELSKGMDTTKVGTLAKMTNLAKGTDLAKLRKS